jgi:hypothetical protein
MGELAQTNVQLVRQVVESGWRDDDLVRLRRAYELAMALFTGQYRGNGKTQVAHHVGTASVLVAGGERPTVVLAGLLHATYTLGEFGPARGGDDGERRAHVRAALGEEGAEVEALVHAYEGLDWSGPTIARLTAEPAPGPSLQRDLVALRVANAADEYADFAMRLEPHRHDPHDVEAPEAVDRIVALADAHGLAALAGALRAHYERGTAVPPPPVLITQAEGSVLVAPASHRRRLLVALQESRLSRTITDTVPGARRAGRWIRGWIT